MLGVYYKYHEVTNELIEIRTIKDCELEYVKECPFDQLRYSKGYVGFGTTDKFANPVDCENRGIWYLCMFFGCADVSKEPFFVARVDANGIYVDKEWTDLLDL